MYAIFACQKNKNRAVDTPCLDPLSYGRDGEPEPHLLLRRGRVSLFIDKDTAWNALTATKANARLRGYSWSDSFDYLILECQDNQPPASGGGD